MIMNNKATNKSNNAIPSNRGCTWDAS